MYTIDQISDKSSTYCEWLILVLIDTPAWFETKDALVAQLRTTVFSSYASYSVAKPPTVRIKGDRKSVV